jgi:DeoR family transcriptional regulator of aga operon
MRQDDRLGLILDRLASHETVGVAELASELAVSAATIRRDLVLLEEQQLLTRTHGGARANGLLYELPMRYRGGRRQDEKRRIAQAVAGLVTDEDKSVALSGGTTTTEVARVLAQRVGLKVVTNAVNIASELSVRPNLGLVVCGGSVRPESYELVGPIADLALAGISVDVAVLGADGVSVAGGVTTHDEVEAATNRAMAKCAQRLVIAADGSKIGVRAFARIVDMAAVTQLVTDTGADADELAAIADLGVSVMTV